MTSGKHQFIATFNLTKCQTPCEQTPCEQKRLSSLGLHKTMNPYNAYKQGKLVDLPFLGNIYLETE